MRISRRDFLKWTVAATAALKVNFDLDAYNTVMAAESDPPVIWLQGAGCSGCFISALNVTNPTTIDDVLLNKISLKFNAAIMTSAGESALASLEKAYTDHYGKYVLVVEGAVPTGKNSKYCTVGELGGSAVTLEQAVLKYGAGAKYVLAAGTCASFGGVSAAKPNPGSAAEVRTVLGGKTANPVIVLPGCPVHATVMVQTLIDVLLTGMPDLDSMGRPKKYYTSTVHDKCPRNGLPYAMKIGESGCFMNLGCMGPLCENVCPSLKWNNGRAWCVGTNHPCIGCAAKEFPTAPLLSNY